MKEHIELYRSPAEQSEYPWPGLDSGPQVIIVQVVLIPVQDAVS